MSAIVAPPTLPLGPAEIGALSRLFDAAVERDPGTFEGWLAALPPADQRWADALRRMVAEHHAPRHPGFMAGGPLLGDESPARAGQAVGPYRLLREIGRGGMSVVWLAERCDGAMTRTVAVKMPLLTLSSPHQVERFARERDLLALLEHRGIARLYDAGVTAGGQPYIALEHVAGEPITQACDRRRIDLTGRLVLFLQVLSAVEHAHRHLVVHRDLKPSNVLVDADGQVKLLDFGIAKLLDAPGSATGATQLTHDAGSAMTPLYAAPEQIEHGPISTATDIYALGVLLYELLAGALPHGDCTLAQALDATLHRHPAPPSRAPVDGAAAAARALPSVQRLREKLAGDLDTIVLKAMRRAPAERYGSAERFADDLRRVLARRPIAARRPTLAYRWRLFVRRHRHASVVAVAGGLASLAFAGLMLQQHQAAAVQAARADAVREFMLDLVESAEPDETQAGAEVTGRQMVDAAARRAHERLAGQPLLLGEVLAELGLMQMRLDDGAKAGRALTEAEALLREHAAADDPALNRTRAFLAEWAMNENDLPRAAALANEVQRHCTQAGAECAKARASAGTMLAQISARRGELPQALQQFRRSVADTELGFGSRHAETAVAWHDLAVFARNAGELVEADAAIRRARELAAATTLRARDRAALDRTQALVDLDLGRYAQARGAFQALLARTSEARERALLLRLSAQAATALGEPAPALELARQALAQATSGEACYAHQAHAGALSLLGHHAMALGEMQGVVDCLAANGYADGSAQMLRARRLTAEALARSGDLDGATGLLGALIVAPDETPAIERAQLLELRGRIAAAREAFAQAAQLHDAARVLLLRQLPEDHALLARNALYAGQARARLNGQAQARLDQLADDYRRRFDAGSSWLPLIAALQGEPNARPARPVVLIL